MNYNVDFSLDFFIGKFEKIPENKIGYTQETGCAYGQCRSNGNIQDGHETAEGVALTKLMGSIKNMTPRLGCTNPYIATPARISNGEVQQYQQPTPKQRILAALYDIKSNQAVSEAEKIISDSSTQLAIERITVEKLIEQI